jgi:VanZ family protein
VKKTAFWLLVAAYCGVIFYLSSLANPLPQLTQHVWDKALHLTEYSGLGVLLALALGVWHEPRKGWRVGLAILLGCLYAVSDETHQSFVPGRDAEVGDAVADTLGTALGAMMVWTLAVVSARSSRIDDSVVEKSG